MSKAITLMLKHRVSICIIFAAATFVGILLMPLVTINYNLIDYLPENAPSTIATDIMEQEYDQGIPNTRVLIPNLSVVEALEMKQRLLEVPGVEDVTWLDDQVDLTIPLKFLPEDAVKDWYQDNTALYSLVVQEENQKESVAALRQLAGEQGALSGTLVDAVNAQSSTDVEMVTIMSVIIPIFLLILFFSTTSWFEPLLFILSLGVAVMINMGTNVFFGEISFITSTTVGILQLACSMDYAIFLLDRFRELRHEGLEPVKAMEVAVAKSASSIIASSMTTIMGFLALTVMQFKIGPDMGLVLAKGIVFSLLSALIFLPCVTLFFYKYIDKTTHRSFMPRLDFLATKTKGVRRLIFVLVALIIIPCFLAQGQVSFIYGNEGMAVPDSKIVQDREKINGMFGEASLFVIMVPKGDSASEQALHAELEEIPAVTSVTSYVGAVGANIPESFVPPDQLSQLNSEKYTRFIVSAKVPVEGDVSFALVEELRDLSTVYYDDSYLMVGESVSIYDMKDTIMSDSSKVNFFSILAIALIILLTFRSLAFPVLLVATIQASVYLNLSYPYFAGQTLNYIGFLIISTVQLGATVDYAILLANRYIENREILPKREAIDQTIKDTAASILVSGGILLLAGLALGIISSNGVISQLGILLSRGAGLSMVLVILLLPTLLSIFEKLVLKTTIGLKFKKT